MHDGVCVCACACCKIYFYTEVIYGMNLSCVPTLSFPEHCDNFGKTQTHRANGRDKDLLSLFF